MTEYVLAWILAGFVKSIHIELPDETVDVTMSKELWQYMVLKLIYLFDGKLSSIRHPVDYRLILLVFQDIKALLDKIGHCVFIQLTHNFCNF